MATAGDKMTRAEWMGVVALMLNVGTIIFLAGVVWQTQQDHSRRIAIVEAQTGAMTIKLERIDANVQFLAERAREDRERMRGDR